MGKYSRQRGVRPYLTTYKIEDLENAVKCVKNGESIGKAAIAFNVPKSTLHRKVQGLQLKKHGGQLSLSLECEQSLLQIINSLTDWKVPLCGYDIRLLVKHYLDNRGVVHSIFKENVPGINWLQGFMKRYQLVIRFADNVKAARFEITPEAVHDFFNHLEKTLEGVPPANVYNFDETNFTDDPSRKKCVVRRGLRRIERKSIHSKQAFSVMFCGSATGLHLPPMVVYKALNVYTSWTEGGPMNTAYASSKSGWFDSRSFEIWFFNIFLPHARTLAGPKVMIGDNLASHFSEAVISCCKRENIRFCPLIPNTTHILQPLDVAVFRPIKIIWRSILDNWRMESRSTGCIPKDAFPQLLSRVYHKLESDHLISGFAACGLLPLNREKVLQRLPGCKNLTTDPGGEETLDVLNESCLAILKQHCAPSSTLSRKCRGKKVIPGKPVDEKQLEEEVNWVCQYCEQAWNDDDDNRWIVCDICDKAFHLQCSGLKYKRKQYNEMDLDHLDFACDDCS